MTTRYVGPGGSDSNDGLSWANRKLTLNGVEDTPVVDGDLIYVGPGTYRETLTCDVNGYVIYMGDVTGDNTDGIGGIVRITGSNDDYTATRSYAIQIPGARSGTRNFRGFHLDMCTDGLVYGAAPENSFSLNLYDCVFGQSNADKIYLNQGDTTNYSLDVARCLFIGDSASGISGVELVSTTSGNFSATITNCVFLECRNGVYLSLSGGATIKSCTFISCKQAVLNIDNGATTNSVLNCIISQSATCLYASGTGSITEDYNSLEGATLRTGVSAGANSDVLSPFFRAGVLKDNYKFQFPWLGELSQYSSLRGITGSSLPSGDFYGLDRPTTAAKKSRGAIQVDQPERETTTIVGASGASLKLADARRVQFRVQTSGAATAIRAQVYWEADYAGTAPQIVIRQPGLTTRTTTASGSAGGWVQLSDTFTPYSDPPWFVVELVSNNTATSGSYAVFFDRLEIDDG